MEQSQQFNLVLRGPLPQVRAAGEVSPGRNVNSVEIRQRGQPERFPAQRVATGRKNAVI
jgi:hypothetical protein